MGQCFSDVAAGEVAAGATSRPDRQFEVLEAVNAVHNGRTKGLSSPVELSLSATNLRDRDKFSKSDPMLVAYIKHKDGSLTEFGRTEAVLNSLEPTWVTQLSVIYNFEEVQQLRFVVYDVDTKLHGRGTQALNLEEQQFLGQADVSLPQIIRAPKQCITTPLQEKKTAAGVHNGRAELTIRAEEMQNSKFLVSIRARCSKLTNLDQFSKSDPFLRISRTAEQGILPVYKTEVKRNDLNPQWKPIKITLQQLCNGDMVRPLTIECFDFESNGNHKLIGKTEASAKDLEEIAGTKNPRELFHERPEHQHMVKKSTGRLHIDEFTLTRYHTFLDYIFGGCEISFMVSIDFTASNGSPYRSESLHYVDPTGLPNAYQKAIQAVGEVVQHYDTDKKFAAWGFGGRPIDGPVSHCFALNGNEKDASVDGVQGILQAYSQAIRNVQLAGPTLFAPSINMAASIAKEDVTQETQKYYVLLIITDGVVTDMEQTIIALIEASDLPLSVLIVGVGDANFADMETLDSDKAKLASPTGGVASRDIVQFVPMRAVARGASLAKMLLGELPFQLLDYMKGKGIVPNSEKTPAASPLHNG